MPREGGAPFPLPFLCMQTIRQLENNMEKMQVNIVTADKVHILYVKMLDVLRAVSPVWCFWPTSAEGAGSDQNCGSPSVLLLGEWGGGPSILGTLQD